jgi:hypothetical protein
LSEVSDNDGRVKYIIERYEGEKVWKKN